MVLVGVGAVMAAVAWVVVLLSPASQRPLRGATTDIDGRCAADDPGRAAERGAGRGRGGRPLDGGAAGDDRPRARSR